MMSLPIQGFDVEDFEQCCAILSVIVAFQQAASEDTLLFERNESLPSSRHSVYLVHHRLSSVCDVMSGHPPWLLIS